MGKEKRRLHEEDGNAGDAESDEHFAVGFGFGVWARGVGDEQAKAEQEDGGVPKVRGGGEGWEVTVFYDFSGGMESSAMLVVDRDRILDTGAVVRFADTGKQFPEMAASIEQIQERLGIRIETIPRRITFDEFLFDKGGMLRQGMTDCSRRMKRGNLARHMKTFPRPYEVNLGYNATEGDRADDFVDRNERDWLHWRFPLLEKGITREHTWEICREAGFTVVVGMYEKMGRFDCFWCPNQRPSQAVKVARYYPELAKEWMEAEQRKGHSFMSVPLKILVEQETRQKSFDDSSSGCACFGGQECFADELEALDNL